MSKKALLYIPESQGGLLKEDPIPEQPLVVEPCSEPKPQGIEPPEDIMTIGDYADYINRPKAVVYRLVKEGKLKSIKKNNKLHIVILDKD